MDVDPVNENTGSSSNLTSNCNMCEKVVNENNVFMQHRKTQHTGSNKKCEDFGKGRCTRSEDDCWYIHNDSSKEFPRTQNTESQRQDFRHAPANSFPPDQMSRMLWMMNNLCRKVEGMEKRFEELMI